MARNKANTKAGLTKRMESEKSLLPTNFKFELSNNVRYLGNLYDGMHGMTGIITKRSNKKNRMDYSVLFSNGREINCILEKVLELVEVSNED